MTFICFVFICSNLNFSQNSIVSSGASVEASEGSFSYTVGQILTSQNLNSSSSVLNDTKVLSHGVQQVFLQKCNENSGVEILATPNPTNGQVTINLKNWDLSNTSKVFYGHLGSAYGFQGQFWFDPINKEGIIAFITGVGDDPAKGQASIPLYAIEERLLRLGLRGLEIY